MLNGEEIHRLRLEQELSQGELGKCLRKDGQYVSKLERGILTNITTDTLEQLATVLQCTADELLWHGRRHRQPRAKTVEQLRDNINWAHATKRHMQKIYREEMRPTLKKLQALLHADRATYSPSGQANAALALDRAVKEFLAVVTELPQEEIIHLTEEPEWDYTGSDSRVPKLS